MTQENEVKFRYLGIKDGCFRYTVTFLGHDFDYFQGLGHTEAKGKAGYEIKPTSDAKLNAQILNACDFRDDKRQWKEVSASNFYDILGRGKKVYRKEPKELDFLYCIKNDSECGNMSFQDFCDNLGYNTDSFKDFEIYRSCEATAQKVRGFVWPEELKDY